MKKEIKPYEEFIRQTIFVKDNDKVLAVFPFNHEISDEEYEMVIEDFDEYEIPQKNEFCLMYEENFGWGWLHKAALSYLPTAKYKDYNKYQTYLVENRIIRSQFVLNED